MSFQCGHVESVCIFFFLWWGGKIPVSYPLTISCYERGNVLESHCFSSFEFLGGHCEFLAPIKKKSIWATFQGGRWRWLRGPTWLLSALGGLVSMPFKSKTRLAGLGLWSWRGAQPPAWMEGLGWWGLPSWLLLALEGVWGTVSMIWSWPETQKGQNVGQQGRTWAMLSEGSFHFGVFSPRLAGTASPAWRALDGALSSPVCGRAVPRDSRSLSLRQPLFVSPQAGPVPHPACSCHPCKVGMGTAGLSLGLYPRLPLSVS